MESKLRKFYVDWWRIRRRTLYGIAALIIASAVIVAGVWWALRTDWFNTVGVEEAPPSAAHILSFEGDVRITRAATRETIVVTKPIFVVAGDTIQTQSDGKATIQMVDGSVYSLGANSSIVIRDNSTLLGGTNVRVSLDDGQMRVRTDKQPENTENVVEMLDTETQVRSETDASFNADASRNGGEIRISRGTVETTVGGERTTINANEFASVNSGKLSSKEKLLAPPRPSSPENAAQIVENAGGGGDVSFSWQDENNSLPLSGYSIQVARTPFFSPDSMLADRGSVPGREFRLAALPPGTYYWRLRSLSRSGQTSEWNEPWRFSVVKRTASPVIEVSSWAVESVGGSVYILSGRTQPGLRVRALGREVFTSGDGTFRIQVSTPLSEVGVEIGDDRGNRGGFVLSLRSAKVVRRF